MKSAVTISLVEEVRGGPFVFWHDLEGACRTAAELGFDGIEVFPGDAASFPAADLRRLLSQYKLQLAAVGTGAGWVRRRLHLAAPTPDERKQAKEFIRGIISVAGEFGAPAIVGSMQGKPTPGASRQDQWNWMEEGLRELGAAAKPFGTSLFVEPLNRYESDLVNFARQARELSAAPDGTNLKVLCDLFHMNIEEVDIARALADCGSALGHVHLADSNRRAAGMGHLDFAPIAESLKALKYDGFLSAEVLPRPDSLAAAQTTIDAFRKYFV